MKRLLITLSLTLSLMVGGCGMNGLFGQRVPTGNQGQVEQEETTKSKVSGNIRGKVKLPESPVLDKNGRMLPNQVFKVDGIEASIPAGATGEVEIDGDGNSSTYTLNSLLSKWKLNSTTTGMMVFGGVMIAAGCVLIYFGAVGVGVAGIIAGFALIACSVLVEKYPWVILGMVLIGIVVGIYFVYNYLKAKSLTQVKDDSIMVIAKIAAEIEKLPADLKTQIKANLQKDDESATIKQVVTEAKNS